MRKSLWAAGLAALALAAHVAASSGYHVGEFGDDAMHWMAARALAGGAYVDLADPARPALTRLLPGYPLLLAPSALLGMPGTALWATTLCAIAAFLAAFFLFRRELGDAGAFAAAAFAAFHPVSLKLAGTLMSDPPFLLLSLLCLAPWRRRAWALRVERGAAFYLYCALVGFTAWVRPHGALLVPVVAFHLWKVRRSPRALEFFAWAGAFALLPYLRNMAAEGAPAAYFGEWSGAGGAALVADNLQAWAVGAFDGSLLALPPGGFILAAWFAPLLALGARRALRQEAEFPRLLTLWAGALALLQLVWVNRDARYLYPLLPFIGYAVVLQLRDMSRGRWTVFLPAAAVLCASSLAFADGRPAPALPEDTYAWIRARTPKKAVLFGANHHTLSLWTGRAAVRRVAFPDPDRFYRELRARGVTHLVFDARGAGIALSGPRAGVSGAAEAAIEAHARDPRRFRAVHADVDEAHAVYALLDEPGFDAAYAERDRCFLEAAAGRMDGALACFEGLAAAKTPLRSLPFYLARTRALAGHSAP